MNVQIISNLVSLLLAFIFAGLAAIHLYSPPLLRNTYQRWGYRSDLPRALGAFLLTSALFLAVPETRVWGGMLAALISFMSVVILLRHGRFACAVPGILVLVALPVAMASGFLV